MSVGTGKKWPGYTDEAHPEVFTVAPPQPKILKAGQLNKEKINKFFDEVCKQSLNIHSYVILS
jgi:hypothetical protein